MESLKECTTAAVGIIAYNEQQYLPALLDCILRQSYTKEKTEIILVDGGSSDNTKKIMEEFQKRNLNIYRSIQVLDNPKRIQPAGWNIVIRHATSDIIMRIDAHALLPIDFVENSMACINSGEYICGGPRKNIIDEDTPFKRMLLDAELSLFGSGFAAYRQVAGQKTYVKSVFHGAYRKEVFDKVGIFNENLIRTEDNEIQYRLRKAGYRICYEPDIQSFYQTRNSLGRMLKQKYQNGRWIGKTIHVCPGCISLFHMAPFAFTCALAMSIVLGMMWNWIPFVVLAIMYGCFNMVNAIMCLAHSKNICDVLLPLVFLFMHLAYGAGTGIGLVQGVRS